MFSQSIQNAFSSDVADELFPHIVGGDYEGDKSFVATARVLLTPHLPADFDGRIDIYFDHIVNNYDEGDVPIIGAVPTGEEARDQIRVFNLSGTDNTAGGRKQAIIDFYAQNLPSYQYDEKLNVFFENSLKFMTCLAFLDREHRNTMVYIENFNNRKNHALQSMLPRLTPWWWEGTSPSPEERALCMSLCSRFPDKVQTGSGESAVVTDGYTALISRYEPLYDFRGAKIRKYLPNFMKRCAEGEVRRLKEELSSIDREVEGLESRISSYLAQRKDTEVRLLGNQVKAERDPDNGLADYFAANRQIDLVSCEGSSITFCVYTLLDWWDDERAPYLVDNQNSEMYTKTGGIKKADYAKLLRAVFVDRTMFIRVCAAYRMDIESEMSGLRGYSRFKDDTWVPNAHIQMHACTGNYRQQFREAIQHGDYVLAMDLAITSAKSMNFGDISFGEFMNMVGEHKDQKVFQDADGNTYTAQEAVRHVKEMAKEAKK